MWSTQPGRMDCKSHGTSVGVCCPRELSFFSSQGGGAGRNGGDRVKIID